MCGVSGSDNLSMTGDLDYLIGAHKNGQGSNVTINSTGNNVVLGGHTSAFQPVTQF